MDKKPRIAEATEEFQCVLLRDLRMTPLLEAMLYRDARKALQIVLKMLWKRGEDPCLALGMVWTFGREKYGEKAASAWQTLDSNLVLWNKAWRHFCDGDKQDEESGLPALWHLLFNLLAIRWRQIPCTM